MTDLLVGLLAAAMATNTPAALSNLVQDKTGASIEFINPNDPVEREYIQLIADDDAAHADIDKWDKDADAFAKAGSPEPPITRAARVRQRLDAVKKEYDDFLQRHPNHIRALLAYGSFLNERGDDEGASAAWEKARKLDPKNPAAWNNLANIYEHDGPISNAFICYSKAIELNPKESVYYHNLAVAVYLYRTDAREFYHLTEQQVFDKSLDLYRQAMQRAPADFILASDYAESFYGTNPPRWKDGLAAWNDVLKLARDETEREGVYIHIARIEIKLGQFPEARHTLDAITNDMYSVLRSRLSRNLDDAIHEAATNTPVR